MTRIALHIALELATDIKFCLQITTLMFLNHHDHSFMCKNTEDIPSLNPLPPKAYFEASR